MNKTEFLLSLQRQISLLEDSEQTDIIDEYSQHIEMKIANGMTEEEAIEDFGPVEVLVSEILSAYHVKAPAARGTFAAPEPEPQPKPIAFDAGKVVEGGKHAVSSAAEATKKGFSSIKAAAGKAVDKAKKKPEHADGDEDAKVKASSLSKMKEGTGKAVAGIARGSATLGSGTASLVRTAVRWCWNIFVAVVVAFFLACALLCLFTFGLCIVLTLQGYPLLGISLAALGLSASSISLTLLSAQLIRRKREAAADPSPVETPRSAYASPFGNGLATVPIPKVESNVDTAESSARVH